MENLDSGFNIDADARKEIEDAIFEYERQIGLPENVKMEPPKYLTMSLEEMRKKTPEELSEAVLELSRYALYIQRIINKHKGWERWGLSKLDEIAAHNIPQIGNNYGFNERVLLAKNTELCKILNKFLRETRLKIDSLHDLPQQIKIIADSIRDIKFIALKREQVDG